MGNKPMTPEKIIQNLTAYNEYRRGTRDFDRTPTPGDIGIAIECAIAYIKAHEALDNVDEDDGK
jgi:hypothetical protein